MHSEKHTKFFFTSIFNFLQKEHYFQWVALILISLICTVLVGLNCLIAQHCFSSYHVMSCHVLSLNVMDFHVMSYHVMSLHIQFCPIILVGIKCKCLIVMSCNTIRINHVKTCHIGIASHVITYKVMFYHVMAYHIISNNII